MVKKRLMLLSMWCLVVNYRASEQCWLLWSRCVSLGYCWHGQRPVWLRHSQLLQPLLQLCIAQHSAGGAELCWLLPAKGLGNANKLWLTRATASLWALGTRPWVSPKCPGAWSLLPTSIMKLHTLQSRAWFERSIHKESRKKGSASLGSLIFLKLTLHLSINFCNFNTGWLSTFDMLKLYISRKKKKKTEGSRVAEGIWRFSDSHTKAPLLPSIPANFPFSASDAFTIKLQPLKHIVNCCSQRQ